MTSSRNVTSFERKLEKADKLFDRIAKVLQESSSDEYSENEDGDQHSDEMIMIKGKKPIDTCVKYHLANAFFKKVKVNLRVQLENFCAECHSKMSESSENDFKECVEFTSHQKQKRWKISTKKHKLSIQSEKLDPMFNPRVVLRKLNTSDLLNCSMKKKQCFDLDQNANPKKRFKSV